MADAQVSGTCGGNTLWVQLPSSAPKKIDIKKKGELNPQGFLGIPENREIFRARAPIFCTKKNRYKKERGVEPTRVPRDP